MLACLIAIEPLHVDSGERFVVRLSSANDRAVCGHGNNRWEPAITKAPAFGMQFWNGDFETGTDAGRITFAFNLAQALKSHPLLRKAVWKGSRVEAMVGRVGAPWPWKTRFKGRVTTEGDNEWPTLQITAQVDVEPFNEDLLTKTYAGTGDGEGGEDLKDQVKPLALGWPRNVEPVLINAVDSVYQFSAYGAIEAVETLYERASAFPASSGDYADYAALVAADIDPGHWATCLAEGLIRLGAPAYGVITGDIKGHAVDGTAVRGAGALVKAMADIAGIGADLIDTEALDRLDAEGATNSDVVVTQQVKFLESARRTVLPCNWQVVVSNIGVLTVMKPRFATSPAFVLHAQGKQTPLVKAVTEKATSFPYKKTVMAGARCWRVHSFDEIAFEAELIDRGDYDAATIYREGNIVTMPGGSRWLYVSETPQAGVTPGTDALVWEPLQVAATYSDGTPIDDLQPAEIGATEGAPSGTPVGSITADDVSDTIKSGGGVADGQVGTGAVTANSITKTVTFFNDFAGWALTAGSFQDVDDGTFAAQVAVATTEFSEQAVALDVLIAMNRAGGTDDNVTIRVVRDSDGAVLDQEYDYDVQGQNWTYASKFFDDTPPASTAEIYKIQLNSDDATLIREVFIQGFLTLR